MIEQFECFHGFKDEVHNLKAFDTCCANDINLDKFYILLFRKEINLSHISPSFYMSAVQGLFPKNKF